MASGNDILMDLRATVDEFERPWAAFIGGVTLHPSAFCARGEVYTVDPTKAGLELPAPIAWPVGAGARPDPPSQFVVIHPDDIDAARAGIQARAGGRTIGDLELAAALYWLGRTMPKGSTRG
jgi:hypothetical protein